MDFFPQKSYFIQPIFHQYVPSTSVSDITPQLSDFTPTALVGFSSFEVLSVLQIHTSNHVSALRLFAYRISNWYVKMWNILDISWCTARCQLNCKYIACIAWETTMHVCVRHSPVSDIPPFYPTLDDILDEGSKFQNRMFISFPQFIYCSRDEVYFPKLSCLIVAHNGTYDSKWAPYNVCYASHLWRHKATCDVPAALWCHVVRGCLGDVSTEDLAIIENNQFTNLIE